MTPEEQETIAKKLIRNSIYGKMSTMPRQATKEEWDAMRKEFYDRKVTWKNPNLMTIDEVNDKKENDMKTIISDYMSKANLKIEEEYEAKRAELLYSTDIGKATKAYFKVLEEMYDGYQDTDYGDLRRQMLERSITSKVIKEALRKLNREREKNIKKLHQYVNEVNEALSLCKTINEMKEVYEEYGLTFGRDEPPIDIGE
jgi:hypothetical protein